MKKSKEILRDPPPDFRLDLALTMVVVGMALIAMGSVACAQDVSLQIEVSDPDASGTMHLKGNVVCTDLHPEGQQIVTNDVLVYVEYMMDDGGKWPIDYESQYTSRYNRPATCLRIGGRCITDEERDGVHVQGGVVLLSKSLEDSDAGKSFSFERDLKPPTSATRARVVAHLEHTLTSGAAKWVSHQHLWDSASFDILLPNPDSDGDGVPDNIDKCRNTPPDTIVDDNGCPAKYDCDDNYVCDHDKGENCAICPKECPCNPGEKCDPSDSNADPWGCVAVAITDSDGDGVPDGDDQCLGTPAGVAVDDKGCPIEMQLSVSTDKKTYSPGETVKTVIIRGSVWDAKGGLTGASIAVDVSGTKLTATTDSSGKYKCEFPLPPDVSPGTTYTVTATASKTGYPDVSKTTSFNVGGEFKVSLKTDKENYAVGDVIKINGVVTSPDPIGSDLELNLEIRIYDSSGSVYRIQRTFIHSDGSYDEQIKIFDKNKPGPLGREGEIGKWRIEAIAKKTGYPDAKADKNIVVQGWCGDQVCQGYDNGEYCYNCSIDCKCEHGKICDPFSRHTKYTDPKTKCSPKVAYIFISTDPNLGWKHKLAMKPRITDIEKFYEKKGYKVVRVSLQGEEQEEIVNNKKTKIWVANQYEIVTRLAKPSTKAIAFFGHGGRRKSESWMPFGFGDIWTPTLGGHPASELWPQVASERKSEYKRLGLNEKNAWEKAMEQEGNIGLDYAYMFACHSLDDNSLRNFLVRKGGTYWGEQGTLFGIWWLEESERTE